MAQANDVTMTTNIFKQLNVSEKLNVEFSEADQKAKLSGKSTVNFISWNTMGCTRAGYALLRKRTFSLISRNSPTDIWLLQEPFSYMTGTLLLNMGLYDLDSATYQFFAENTYTSRQDACIIYNNRKFRCLQNAYTLHQCVRQIIQNNQMPFTLASRLCAILLQTIDDGTGTVTPTRFVVVSYHGIYRTSDENKLTQITYFHQLCHLLCQHFRVPVIIGSDYNIDIRSQLQATNGFPPFLRVFNYAACRMRNNTVIHHWDYDDRTDVEKIDYFAIVSPPRSSFFPNRCEALSVLMLQNRFPYSGDEYATEVEARELFRGYTETRVANLQLVSNHDPLFLSIDLYYADGIFN